jgi:hypothetical protein
MPDRVLRDVGACCKKRPVEVLFPQGRRVRLTNFKIWQASLTALLEFFPGTAQAGLAPFRLPPSVYRHTRALLFRVGRTQRVGRSCCWDSVQAWFQPYRYVANLRKHFRQSVAAAAALAVTHPPRKSRLLPHEKSAPRFCLRFVATKSHDVNVRRGPLLATRLKRLTQLRISHPTAGHARRAASPHATQVLQATMDFGACEFARRVMRTKRLKRRAFSLSSARRKLRTAFGLPQRA